MVTHKKILPATRKRLAALRLQYRAARQYFYAVTGRMDRVWANALDRLALTAGADGQAAVIDALEADLKPFLAAVPPDAPPAAPRGKAAAVTTR